MKGLEPEIQRLIAKHKGEIKKIKQIHEAELLESDERAAQKYVRMTEELRDQLADEKEAACGREREMAKQRYSLVGTKYFNIFQLILQSSKTTWHVSSKCTCFKMSKRCICVICR